MADLNFEFKLETSYEHPEPSKLQEKFPNITKESSVEELAEAVKKLRAETPEVDEKINLSTKPQVKSLTITPAAGFAYKTTRLSDKKKIFINITTHEILEKPGVKKKLDKDGNEVEGINIPISVGMPREEKDKKDQECVVYDLIVNPEVIQEIESDKTGRYREFLCQLGIQSLEQKYKEPLDKRYKIPKLAYFGSTIPSQQIQDRKSMPKIEEVNNKAQSKSSKVNADMDAKLKKEKETVVIPEIEKDLFVSVHWIKRTSSSAANDDFATSLKRLHQFQENDGRRQFATVRTDSEGDEFERLAYKGHALNEYSDPVTPSSEAKSPENQDLVALSLEIEFESYLPYKSLLTQLSSSLSISSFRCSIKLPGYKKYLAYLPIAILPLHSFYDVYEIEGFVSHKRLIITLGVDPLPYGVVCDPGSKPWLVSQALSTEETDTTSSSSIGGNPYRISLQSTDASGHTTLRHNSQHKSTGDKATNIDQRLASDHLPEDKFHIKLPSNVDQYTGIEYPPNMKDNSRDLDDFELPEDRFHKKDAGSSFILSQREQTKKEKWERHEKEKAERQNDPNVEYVEMEDFKPGGKFGPKTSSGAAPSTSTQVKQSEDLTKAANILLESQQEKLKNTISSNLWTELLD